MKAYTRKTVWLAAGVASAILVWFTVLAPGFTEVTGLNFPTVELPVVQSESIILVSGSFTCDPGSDCSTTGKADLSLIGTIYDPDGAGEVSFTVFPTVGAGLINPATVPFTAEIVLKDQVSLTGLASASIAFNSALKGSWTASAYVTQAASLDANGEVKVSTESVGSLTLSPYWVGLADPRPSPLRAVFEPNG